MKKQWLRTEIKNPGGMESSKPKKFYPVCMSLKILESLYKILESIYVTKACQNEDILTLGGDAQKTTSINNNFITQSEYLIGQEYTVM